MKATCANHTTSKWKSWDFIPILYDSNSMSLDKRIYCFSSQTVLADSISTKILNILKKKKKFKVLDSCFILSFLLTTGNFVAKFIADSTFKYLVQLSLRFCLLPLPC